jgi:uncharacterized protein (TIGR00369 family)
MKLDADALRSFVEDAIPFNTFLGLKLESCDPGMARVVTRLELEAHHIGNPVRKMPHGGVISFMIDATAGAAAALSLNDAGLVDKIATIDMRVDYLKAARGTVLFATAEVMRTGNRIVVVRSSVHDDAGLLVALGSNVFNIAR